MSWPTTSTSGQAAQGWVNGTSDQAGPRRSTARRDSGPPEFGETGTSIAYRAPSGDQTFTVTTYRGVAISCFSNAWAYPNTEIARIGGDAGVIAQLSGDPTAAGTYRALWNHSHDTLIGLTTTGIDRDTLIDLADQLVPTTAPPGTRPTSNSARDRCRFGPVPTPELTAAQRSTDGEDVLHLPFRT